MQVCLGRRYEADPGIAAHYDGTRAGLAIWFRRIVDADARAHGIDPDTATWEGKAREGQASSPRPTRGERTRCGATWCGAVSAGRAVRPSPGRSDGWGR